MYKIKSIDIWLHPASHIRCVLFVWTFLSQPMMHHKKGAFYSSASKSCGLLRFFFLHLLGDRATGHSITFYMPYIDHCTAQQCKNDNTPSSIGIVWCKCDVEVRFRHGEPLKCRPGRHTKDWVFKCFTLQWTSLLTPSIFYTTVYDGLLDPFRLAQATPTPTTAQMCTYKILLY